MFQRFFSLLALAGAISFHASAYEVTALTTDSVGEALPYVTYRVFGSDSTKPEYSDISGLDGTIRQTIASAGAYRIVLSYTGMADAERSFDVSDATPVADLGDITLSESATVLQGVTV